MVTYKTNNRNLIVHKFLFINFLQNYKRNLITPKLSTGNKIEGLKSLNDNIVTGVCQHMREPCNGTCSRGKYIISKL